ncbi:MAG: transcription termination factor NusA [Anaerolineae bacterium]
MTTATGSRSELMAAIRGLSAARDLPPEVIIDALKAALASAYHKIPGGEATNVTVDLNEVTGESRVFAHYAVVEEQYIEDPESELTVEQARKRKPDAVIGDVITIDVTPHDFGRIAAQTAKQVILQRIREAEREQTYTTYADREGEIVYGTIQTTSRDSVTVALDRVEALLPKGNQIPGERYTPNQRLRVYVAEVKRSPKGPQVIVSRTHREMLRRLMELEIPEVFQGSVELKAIAREAGSRSKVAVWAHQDGVDPVGACVGMRGVRIQALVRELGGEKIDIVEWAADPRVFIAHALSPAKVVHVWLEEEAERRTANVVVPDTQLSLAIGREGQNARLAAKLTGWRIDIRAESEAGDVMEALRAEETARLAEKAKQEALAAEAAAAEQAAEEATTAEPDEEYDFDEYEYEYEPAATADEDEHVAPAAETGDETVMPPAAAVAPELEAAAPPPDTQAVEAPVAAPDQEAAADRATAEPVGPTQVEPTEPHLGERPAAHGRERQPREVEDEAELELLRPQQRGHEKRRLVRDPKTGELVARTTRKSSRRRPEWEEEVGRWSEEDFVDAMGFTEADFLGGADDDDSDVYDTDYADEHDLEAAHVADDEADEEIAVAQQADWSDEDEGAADQDEGAADQDEGAADQDEGAAHQDEGAADQDEGAADQHEGATDQDEGAAGDVDSVADGPEDEGE